MLVLSHFRITVPFAGLTLVLCCSENVNPLYLTTVILFDSVSDGDGWSVLFAPIIAAEFWRGENNPIRELVFV